MTELPNRPDRPTQPTLPTQPARSASGGVRGRVALLATAALFGGTFVVVSESVRDLTPAAFISLRFSVGALALAPFCRGHQAIPMTWTFWRPALLGGLVLAAGYATQTVGLEHITPSASGFITGLYVGATPVIAWIVARHRPSRGALAGTAMSVVGLYVLTGGVNGLGRGEGLTIVCALAFACHIVIVATYAHRLPLVPFTVSQLLIVAAAGLVWLPAAGFGHVSARAVGGAVSTGLAASALAFLLQIFGQRSVEPTRSALLLSLEPVFAGVFGYWAGDRLGGRGWAGAAIIMTGTVLAEATSGTRPCRPRRPGSRRIGPVDVGTGVGVETTPGASTTTHRSEDRP